MSRFYASIEGQASSEATRRGGTASGISGHVRGWDSGVAVNGYVDDQDRDVFEIYATGGSNGGQLPLLIATVVAGQVTIAVKDRRPQEMFEAIGLIRDAATIGSGWNDDTTQDPELGLIKDAP